MSDGDGAGEGLSADGHFDAVGSGLSGAAASATTTALCLLGAALLSALLLAEHALEGVGDEFFDGGSQFGELSHVVAGGPYVTQEAGEGSDAVTVVGGLLDGLFDALGEAV